MYGLKSLRENDQLEIESRRACPELVERGRLNLAQDAVLGWHARGLEVNEMESVPPA
jgi:hypothetical protein